MLRAIALVVVAILTLSACSAAGSVLSPDAELTKIAKERCADLEGATILEADAILAQGLVQADDLNMTGAELNEELRHERPAMMAELEEFVSDTGGTPTVRLFFGVPTSTEAGPRTDSAEAAGTYVGLALYGDRFGVDLEQYEEGFGTVCDVVSDTEALGNPAWNDRFGLRWMAINDWFDVIGVGWELGPATEEADTFRHFTAIHMDEAVQHECRHHLDAWLTPGTYEGGPVDMDDPVMVPVPPFTESPG